MKKLLIGIAVVGLITSIAFAAEDNNLVSSGSTVVPAVTTSKDIPAPKTEKKAKKQVKKVVKHKKVKKNVKKNVKTEVKKDVKTEVEK